MAHIEAVGGQSRAGRVNAGRSRNSLIAFALSDAAALGLAALSTLALTGHDLTHGLISASLGAAAMVWMRARGHYRVRQALCNQIRPLLQAAGLCFLAASTAYFVLGHDGLQIATATMWALAAPLMLGFRFAARAILESAGLWKQPVILITPFSARADHLLLLGGEAGHGLHATRTVDLTGLADLDDRALSARLESLDGAMLFIAPDDNTQATANRIVDRLSARGATFYYQPAIGRVSIESFDVIDHPPSDGLVLRLGDSLDRPAGQRVKRAFDAVVAVCALALLSPLFAALALLIRRDGGPALFIQPRVGRKGRLFGCLKFRSMAMDAEARLARLLADDPARAAEWAAYQKLSDDPRITPMGRFIRRFSLDELPQLINVARGEMSLVGPRPMTAGQREAYGGALEAYIRMRPGITGMWQVNGRNATTFSERARLDDWYARNWSLWRDAVILLRTMREVIRPSGG